MKKPNQPLSKEDKDILLGDVASLGFYYMDEFGMDEIPAFELAYKAMEVKLLNDKAELMAKELKHG